MKKVKQFKIFIFIFLLSIFMPIFVLADTKFTVPEYTEEYKKWLELSDEEKADSLVPKMYDNIAKKDEELGQEKIENSRKNLGLPTKYERQYWGKVKDQGSTDACWAYSATTVFESSYYTMNGMKKQFSNLHMDYITSQYYNPNGFARIVDSGGTMELALAYATNGMGIALDSRKITNPTKEYRDAKVDEYVNLYTINDIKKYIQDFGVVSTQTYVNTYSWEYFSSSDVFNNKDLAYYYDGNVYHSANHAVTIIGWDDNYKNDAFPGKRGAFKILNSWGTDFGDNGTYYIFYDDKWVLYDLYGVTSVVDTNYDNIYQYDECGHVQDLGILEEQMYAANVFNKQSFNDETITEVGVYFPQAGNATIYINPNGPQASINNATVQIPVTINKDGYYTIRINNPVKINSNQFTVGVKYPGSYFGAETSSGGVGYWLDSANANPGESFYSVNGYEYYDLNDDVSDANVCIKVFTEVSKDYTGDLINYVFNAKYYAEQNRDLFLVFGYNEEALRNHWNNFGIREGRKSSPVFDVSYYLNNNPDISNAFGSTNYIAAYNHFMQSGYDEYRGSSAEYNGTYYKNYNSDLAGMTSMELIRHYSNYGKNELRKANTNYNISQLLFNSAIYAECNPDIVQVFGYNETALRRHWYEFGIREGRIASLIFDAKSYLASNPDVAKIFTNYEAAYNHFVNFGFAEGRNGNAIFSASYYLTNNDDIKNAYKDNFLLAANHFIYFGKNELQRLTSPYFNVKRYREINTDLISVYGNNFEMYYKHYIRFGQYEGRICR